LDGFGQNRSSRAQEVPGQAKTKKEAPRASHNEFIRHGGACGKALRMMEHRRPVEWQETGVTK
jgi:hypothetical protein